MAPIVTISSQDGSIENGRRDAWAPSKLKNLDSAEKDGEDVQNAIRVLIVDRDALSSNLLADALVRDGGCDAIAVPSEDLTQTIAASQVHLLVIGADVSVKSRNGFDLAHAVYLANPNIFIVIILNQSTHETVVSAFRSGARGVISREQPLVDFLDCVEHVRKGCIWAGRQETTALLEAFKSMPSPSLIAIDAATALTARELEVVQCVSQGKTNKAIATELRLSEHTVKNYLFRAFEKLGVSSRVELLFYLTRRGHTFPPSKTDDIGNNLNVG